MSEYIERATVLQILAANLSIFEDSDESARVSMVDISALPALDVMPVRHGHWIDLAEEHTYQCSLCQSTERNGCYYLYCPHCAARMDGDEK